MLPYIKKANEAVVPATTADPGKVRLGGGYRLPIRGA